MTRKRKPYEGTKVNYIKSQAEIGEILTKEGIYNYQFTHLEGKVILRFVKEIDFEGRKLPLVVQIDMPIPKNADDKKHAKERDRLFRVLKWWIKSKFEAINSGIYETYTIGFVKEFYPNLVFRDGKGYAKTLYDLLLPQLVSAVKTGRSNIKMLPDLENEQNEH